MAVGTDAEDWEKDGDAGDAQTGSSGRETEAEMRRRILEEIERERQALEAELREMKEKEHKLAGELCDTCPPRRSEARDRELTRAELSADQRQAIFAAPDFSSFIEESSRIVQRALSDGYDYIKDYTIGLDGAL
jgi:dynein intermediate chain